MGINRESIYLIKKWKDYKNIDSFMGLAVCELGNQHIKHELVKYRTGKEWFVAEGAIHVSIDINGQDGAEPIDLSKPIKMLSKRFDLITNFGTTEHVSDQYQVFKNIHNMLKREGCFIHCLPRYGCYPRHSPFKYKRIFIEELSVINKYEVLFLKDLKRRDNKYQVGAVLKKTEDIEFITEDQFTKINGLFAESDYDCRAC